MSMRLSPWFLLLNLFSLTAVQATVEVRSQLVSVHEKGEDGRPKAAAAGGRGPKPIEQNRALEVTVRNQSNNPESGITVRYWFLGRDAKTSKVALLEGGESQLNLKPNGIGVVTSDAVKSSYTPRPVFVQPAAKAAKGGRPPASAAPPKEATGTRISGYAVQVIKEGKVIGSDIMDDSIKMLIGSDGTTPGPLFKAEKPQKAAE